MLDYLIQIMKSIQFVIQTFYYQTTEYVGHIGISKQTPLGTQDTHATSIEKSLDATSANVKYVIRSTPGGTGIADAIVRTFASQLLG
jgi:hypothetical protein